MRAFSILSGLGAVALAIAQNDTQPICDKYAAALFQTSNATTQYALLTALVNTAVLGNSSANVTGILNDGDYNGTKVSLAKYFDGSLASTNRDNKAVSVNFLDGGAGDPLMKGMPANDTTSNQYFLLTHLYEYFGALLGCSGYGSTEFPAYAGDTGMYEVHKFMDLSYAEVAYFIQEVAYAGASFGVSISDLSDIGQALGAYFNYKCLAPEAIIPGQGAELQSVCIADDCPIALANATCSAYQAAVSPSSSASNNVYTAKPKENLASTATTGTTSSATTTGTSTSSAGAAITGNNFSPMLGAAGLAAFAMVL